MKFTIGNVFGLCFSIMGKALWPLLAVTVLIYLGLSVVTFGVLMLGDKLNMFGSPLYSLVTVGVSYTGFAAFWCAVTDIALQKAAGKPVMIGGALRNCGVNALPVLAVGLLWLIGASLGLIFLIVPGIIFMVMFAVVVPAFIQEKAGIFGAFSRSRALTKGRRWGIFAINLIINVSIYLIVLVGVFLFQGLGVNVTGVFNGTMTPVAEAGAVILFICVWIAAIIFFPTLNTALYVVLRGDRGDRGEPVDGAIARVFE